MDKVTDDGVTYKLYRFKANNRFFFVEVHLLGDTHIPSVYGVKFYPKHLSNSKKRFKTILNEFEFTEVRKIIFTVFEISLNILRKDDSNASFAFIGENSQGEDRQNTKRYRVYKSFITFLIGEGQFEHFYDDSSSCYFLLNKVANQSRNICMDSVVAKFSDYLSAIE